MAETMGPVIRPRRAWLGVVLALGLSGCASSGVGSGGATRTAGSVARPPAGDPAAPRTAVSAASPAASLLEEARSLEARGAWDEAGSVVERAVRLDPASAEAWLFLARLRAADGDPQGARDFALRALSVAGDEPDTARSARRFLDRVE